jgi:signal transduction histidine kinase
LKKDKEKTDEYIEDLEEKIIDLSLQLKSKSNELNSIVETNKKTLGKLVHNLKNPVGVVFSFSDMIIGSLEDYTTDKLAKHLEIIKNSADFSIKMLNAIAVYSQVNSLNRGVNLKSVNYLEIVNKLLNEFETISKERNINIEKDFPKNEICLNIDESELTIALRNILNNSFRYSSNNTTIKISIKDNLDSVETTISDDGIGISDENLPHIFNEFFVVNTYSDDKQKCIGLGLTISKKIIQYFKGTITALSTIDKGSSFFVHLPKN